MSSFVQIFWTAASKEEAISLSRKLLEKKLVACVSLFPITSLFRWEGDIQEQSEVKVIFKTIESHFEEVKIFLLKNTSYEIPEIVMIPLTAGNEEYLNWVFKEVV